MDVPDAAKDVKRFIKTGEALQAQAPYATFWCWMHALEVMVPRVQQDPSLQGFVIQLMDSVEQMKTQHGQLSSVSDKDTGRESVALLAAKIFQQADREDHAGATMGTALKFRTASTLFDVCKAMNPDIDEFAEQRKYAKVKMVTIQRAIKAGKTPVPGPVDMDGNPIQTDVSSVPSMGDDGVGPGSSSSSSNMAHAAMPPASSDFLPPPPTDQMAAMDPYSSSTANTPASYPPQQPDMPFLPPPPSTDTSASQYNQPSSTTTDRVPSDLFPSAPTDLPQPPSTTTSSSSYPPANVPSVKPQSPPDPLNPPERPPFHRPAPPPTTAPSYPQTRTSSSSSTAFQSIDDVPADMPGVPPCRGRELSSKQEQLIQAACKRIVSSLHFHDAEGAYTYLVRALNVLQCDD